MILGCCGGRLGTAVNLDSSARSIEVIMVVMVLACVLNEGTATENDCGLRLVTHERGGEAKGRALTSRSR